jgi:hypothetical protein
VTCDQILLPVGMLLSEICGLFSVGLPLRREDGPAICSVITQWSESRRTRNHTLLSHLRLPRPGGPGCRIYIPQDIFSQSVEKILANIFLLKDGRTTETYSSLSNNK